MKKIGIVGVGLMGRSLAMHLLNAGYTVFVHDLVDANVDAAVKLGAKRVSAPADMTTQTDVIMLSLPNSNIVNDVVQNALRLFECKRKDLVLIDTSTPDPETSIGLARRLREHGIEKIGRAHV